MKAADLSCAYVVAVVDRDPNHILAVVADEDIHVEAGKSVDEADRQPSFYYCFRYLLGIQWASCWQFLGAR